MPTAVTNEYFDFLVVVNVDLHQLLLGLDESSLSSVLDLAYFPRCGECSG